MTKQSYLTVAWLLLPFYTLFAQLVTTDPAVPLADQPVTITFDATLGTGGLADCNCDVYLHTGVITNLSTGPSNWRYVPTVWGEANPAWRLDPVPGEPDKYTYTYEPSIRGYFNVPAGETIEQLAMVFRNADGSLEGKAAGGADIFVDVSQGGGVLSVNLQGDPGAGFVQPLGAPLTVTGGSSIESSMTLYDNGTVVATSTGQSITHDLIFQTPGEHVILLEAASDDGQTAEASFTVTAALRVTWLSPLSAVTILDIDEEIDLTATALVDAEISLLLDDVLIATNTATVNTTQSFTDAGVYTISARAVYNGDTTFSERTIVVGGPDIQNPPPGFDNGITRTDDGLYLQLYAEGKNDVYVIGNHNDWTVTPEGRMNRSADGKIFWIELTDLPENEDLIFQYFVDYELRVADPYSELVLDRFNDPFIPNSVFPGIPDYPVEHTDGIVSWVRLDPPEYNWNDQDFTPIEGEKLVIYELLIRDFLEDHSYASLMDTLDYLQRLGINAIELMPVNEFEGNISWGYNPSFHMALDKYYGTPEALKAVVDACHQRGMSVILDIVYNHAFSQSSLAQLWWDPVAFRPTPDNPYLNVEATHPFNVGYDFNHESPATKDYVKTGLRYWIEEFHVDGYRFDLSKGFTQNQCNDDGCAAQYDASRIAILTDYADEVWDTKDEAYVILEHFASNSEQNQLAQYGNGIYFWSGYNPHNEYLEASMGYLSNLNSVLAENRGFTTGNYLVSFMESHDEERMQYKNEMFGNSFEEYDVQDPSTGFDRVQLASTFFYTLPGPKMLWQFGELGYDFPINYCPNGTTDPNCRVDPKPIRWDYTEVNGRADIYNHIRSLLFLRNNYDVFHTDNYNVSLGGYGKSIHLLADEFDVAIVGNFGVFDLEVEDPFPHGGTWYDYLTGTAINVTDPTAALPLSAGEYRIYLTESITPPEAGLPTSVTEVADAQSFRLRATPNPSAGTLSLSYELDRAASVKVDVLDVSGRSVGNVMATTTQTAGLHTEQLSLQVPPGLYFLRLTADSQVATLKVVVQ